MDFDLHLPAWVAAILILILLVVSAFFAIAETALVSSSRPRLHALARKGNPRAVRVNRMRERQDHVLSAILLGNNLVNVFASAIATGLFIDLFGPTGVAYAAVAMTVLVVVFAEVLPKTYALNRADRVVLSIVPALESAVRILGPLNHANRWLVRGILRLVGAQRPQRSAEAAVEELRGAIELHSAPDPDVRRERAMLRSILDLADVQVGEIMVHRRDIFAIDADRPATEILEQALLSQHTRVPLWRGQPDNIVGVLHAKEMLRALRAHGGNAASINVLEVASRPWFIPESTSLLDQLEAFRRRREHFALVVDEYGALLGIVTLEDILEEIVGDIAERHEFKMPGVRPQPDGTLVVDGHVTIRDLNRQFDWRLPDEVAATVAGLVLHEARRIPDVGQVFNFYGFRFEVLRRKRNQIAALRITPPAAQPATVPVATEA
ncbi:MAG TPA: HlyC/CorC family transporter [Alphaproteobacteria bacterium]|nr:HlyC/CorC family transporter [Alphaproteobacteria bacterium]